MAGLESIGGIHYEMMRRCYAEGSVSYKDYGAKGIKVCSEWHDRETFRKWALENGYVKGLRLNRIDSTKDYCPENCLFGNKNSLKNGIARYSREVKQHRKEIKELCGVPNRYSNSRIYRIFVGIHTRCENITHPHYQNYGGRGIKVCEEWSGKDGFFYFYKWSMENGYKINLSIDRKDNDKGYSPDNCQWATVDEQIRNRRVSKKFIYKGKEVNLKDVAEAENVTYGKLYSRVVQKCMKIEEALNDIRNSTD